MALNKDNMANEVEKGADSASGQEEVKKEGAAASTATAVSAEDIVALTKALELSLEREKKLAEERDNYKEGLLKAKGKLKPEEGEEEKGAEEKVITETPAADSSELAGVVKELLKRNQEMVTAIVNKAQVATTGQGTSSEAKVEVGDNLLSAGQLQDLKSRGWNDEKIARFKENLKKSKA